MRRKGATVVSAILGCLTTASGLVGTIVQARTARTGRDFAIREVARSSALNEFHRFLLSDAAPSGQPLTISQLLGRAERIAARQHPPNDSNGAELMVVIGHQYLEQDETSSARRVLEQAYNLSHGLPDPSVRAEASCGLAASLARDEEASRVEVLIREGLKQLPTDPQFALVRIACLQNGSEVARDANDVQQGLARSQAALDVLRQSPFDSDVLEMHCWNNLAKSYCAAGQHREAILAFERTASLVSVLGRNDTATAATLFNDWGLELYQSGHLLEAQRMFERSIRMTRARQTEETVSPIVLNNYARTLEEMGLLQEAAENAERAYGRARRVGNQRAIDQSLVELARIYVAQHDPARAAAMLAEVEPRLRHNLPAGHYAFAVWHVCRRLLPLKRVTFQPP